MIKIKDYIRAGSLEEAYELNQKRSACILGGMLWTKMGERQVQTAIDLSGLGLDQIEESEEEFSIGCMVTLRQMEEHEGLNVYTDGAARECVRSIVGVQFRNLATVGGSIFGRFGFSDVLTLFLALDTEVELVHAAIDVVIRNSNIHHSTMGIWLDWEAQGTRISGNLFHHNNAPSEDTPLMFGAMMCQDVFVEVSHGPTLIDNNIMLSQTSVRIASQGVALVHNLFLGALTGIGGGTDNIANGVIERRYTPYHIRHETEVAGFMTILHGDDRIYNNIFVQNEPVKEAEVTEDMGFTTVNNNICGTEIFDSFLNYQTWIDQFDMEHLPDMTALQDYHFRSLPVWINGNVYLNGARSWKLEKDKFVDHTHKVTVELIEEGNQYRLKTNLAQVLKDYTTGMICTQTLGKAFEPDEYFENPDGTPIIFDRDYFSEHRSINVIPGPFADLAKAEDGLWY